MVLTTKSAAVQVACDMPHMGSRCCPRLPFGGSVQMLHQHKVPRKLTSAVVSVRVCWCIWSRSMCCCKARKCSECCCRIRLLMVGSAAGDAVVVGMTAAPPSVLLNLDRLRGGARLPSGWACTTWSSMTVSACCGCSIWSCKPALDGLLRRL